MALLDSAVDFSGTVVVSPFEDTSYIRERCGSWKERVVFRTKSQGDTLGGLAGVVVECTWPPSDAVSAVPVEDGRTNRYSLCFSVRYGHSVVAITSDIDTVAEGQMAQSFAWELKSDMLVVPHHGSGGSVGRLFFGYVRPSYAAVSCALVNPYGHPSEALLDLLFEMGTEVFFTFEGGTLAGSTNGDYWVWGPACPR
jgi:beta-lactamase superfamily II metal-dependent hydrolase